MNMVIGLMVIIEHMVAGKIMGANLGSVLVRSVVGTGSNQCVGCAWGKVGARGMDFPGASSSSSSMSDRGNMEMH
jgi:hypothetical protein